MFVLTLLSCCLLLPILSAATVDPSSKDWLHGKLYEHWKLRHNKNYATQEEENFRRSVWKKSLTKIQDANANKTYGQARFGLTQFSDWTEAEFKSYTKCHVPKSLASTVAAKECWDFNDPRVERPVEAPPASIDWRTKGAVTGVKNQGQCGSCWSFGTTGTLEGANFLKWGKLISLSEQNLVDCSGICCYNEGCNGGRVDWALEYVIKNGGIDTEASYPYQGEDGSCNFQEKNIGGNATNCITLPVGDENSLKVAVGTIEPVAVAISVDDAWANYQSGVYTSNSCPNGADQLDHSVLVVGYGTENGEDYWLVKNSWGASWGDHGYIKMRRNYNNMCGIATDAVYPYF